MKKLIVLLMLSVMLVGCKSQMVKTEYVEVKVPVNSVPQPPVVSRPVPETSLLTTADRKDIGKVAKAVTVERDQWKEYSSILETIINKYKELADKAGIQTKLEVTLPPKPTSPSKPAENPLRVLPLEDSDAAPKP